MKKLTIVLLILATVIACSKKTIATTETKTQNGSVDNGATASTEVALTNERLVSNIPVKSDAASVPADATAAGKVLFTHRCGTCHALKTLNNYTAKEWDGILQTMVPRARLNSEEQKHVTAYIKANAKK